MKDSCQNCGIVVDLEYVKIKRTEREEQTRYSSDKEYYNHIYWNCPVCETENNYSEEFEEARE